MMKLVLICLSLFVGLQLGADEVNRFTRKGLVTENRRLRAELDSLRFRLDSLEKEYDQVESDIVAFLEGQDSEAVIEEQVEYTPEVTDSLLHLWYRNSFVEDLDLVREYNMDSIRFTSNISDEEIEKRLLAMNSFISLPYNSVVKNYIVLYSEKMHERMGRVMGLSQYWFPVFEETFDRYGLPLELKYLAVIESMMNPLARSRAGASGMWQFMYTTARNYGLEINSYVDERLDVEKSVDAAARYLRDAYKIFGDWTLAISAYNCGSGNVSKAIRRAGGKRDFWSIYPYLPRETRGYMPAFVGAMYAMTYYREYGIVPQDVGMPATVDTFEISRNLHFDQITAVAGVPTEVIKTHNPQYLHNIIPGNSHSYILKLPYTWTTAFVEANTDSLYAYKADSLMSSRVQKDISNAAQNNGRIAYRVRSGDYLGRIAQRYGVTVNQLKSWNNLRSSNIRVGQLLYIYPRRTPVESVSTSSSSSSSSSGGSNITSSSSSQGSYTVRKGDSLYTIAKHYPGVSADDIKRANNLRSNKIMPGQVLKIPSRN